MTMFAKTITAALVAFLMAGTAQAQFYCPPPQYCQPVYVAPADHIVIQGVCAPYKSRFDSTIRYGSVWRKVPIINGIAPQVHISRMSNGGKRTIYDYSDGVPYRECEVYGQEPASKPAVEKPLPPREELDGFVPRQAQERERERDVRPVPPSEQLQFRGPEPQRVREPVNPVREPEPELPLPPREDLGDQPFEAVAPRGMVFPNQVPSSENVVRPTYEAPNE